MPRVLKIGGSIFGVYLGLSSVSAASHFFSMTKVNSFQTQANNKSRALDASYNVNSKRKEIENTAINMFGGKTNEHDISLLDENCEFEDGFGRCCGKKTVRSVFYVMPVLMKNHVTRDVQILQRYSNAFTFSFDQSFAMFGIEIKSLPTLVYVEMNDDNSKITKMEDHWFGRPFFWGFGTGNMIRKFNGKVIYQGYLPRLVDK